MFSPHRPSRFVFAGFAVLTTGVGAMAQAPAKTRTIDDFIQRSDLVFHGAVVHIEYANALPAADAEAGIPHTFVTYRVDEVFLGTVLEPELTLRFLGGYDAESETYLAASLSPQFDLGDEDVLFVRGNGASACPLVENHGGRLRVIDGQVYTDTGRAVTLGVDGVVLKGDRYDLPEVTTTHVLDEVLWLGHDPGAKQEPSAAMRREMLTQFVATAAGGAKPRNAFVSADVDLAFESPFPSPVKMRDALPRDRPEPALAERDQ